jgi:hypothetical protein
MYFALFPFAHNIGEVGFDYGFFHLRYFIIIIVGVFILTLGVRWRIKDELRTGVTSTIIIFFIFSYGYFKSFLDANLPIKMMNLDFFLLPLWIGLFVVICWWVNKRARSLQVTNQALNFMSLVLLVFPIYNLVQYNRFLDQVVPQIDPYLKHIWEDSGVLELEPIDENSEDSSFPDIYYIILDGYTRADVLQQYFNYSNTQFLDFLTQRGFYIAEHSSANFSATAASIPSSLNMSYVNDLPDYLRSENPDLDNFRYLTSMSDEIVEKSRVIGFLRENGYHIVSFDSGCNLTRIESGDVYFSSPKIHGNYQVTAFELMILESSLGGIFRRLRGEDFEPLKLVYDDHRERILYTLENLPNVTETPGPRFVLAHIVSPHTPYVFDANGEPIYNSDPYTLLDSYSGGSSRPEFYSDQVQFLNKQVMIVVDEILQKSPTPPIIILQGDHSHRVFYKENIADESELDRLFPILNAYYFPNRSSTSLYPSISPVNSFRVVFNEYFGTDLEYLPDERFIFQSAFPQEFIAACDVYNCEGVIP